MLRLEPNAYSRGFSITSSPCLGDTTNHEKGGGDGLTVDSVSPRHLAARRSFKCGAAVATASPLTSLIWTLQWYHELSALGRKWAMPKSG
jgi:hypothetical protein